MQQPAKEAAIEFDLYNAADDLIGRNLAAGYGARTAIVDRYGAHSFDDLNRRVARFANVLTACGVAQEQRVLLVLHDSIDFHTCFLGAIKAGAVPVPVNTLLKSQDYGYVLADSRARMLVIEADLLAGIELNRGQLPYLQHVLVAGDSGRGGQSLAALVAAASDQHTSASTRPDDAAFWLYTSGTTGRPKAAIHCQTDLRDTARHYAEAVLGVTSDDVLFSAPKLFFAYGLGNGLTFPLWAGATAVLMAGKTTAAAVREVIDRHHPTLFFGVPTLYAMMLNSGALPEREGLRLRHCISAGEALPETIFHRWRDAVGVDILDAIGSTEMLHMFISNRPGDVRAGTSGKPLAGYELRLLGEDGQPAAEGESGDLYVSGPTAAMGYWNQRAQTLKTFQGRWVRTGDVYRRDADGYYIHCGRSDDLLKVGGIYVSPMEVENALLGHPAVAEAAVVAGRDEDQLTKPKAYVVLNAGVVASVEVEQAIIAFTRSILAEYKRPRWVVFVAELPKTATGKIRRYVLRDGSEPNSL